MSASNTSPKTRAMCFDVAACKVVLAERHERYCEETSSAFRHHRSAGMLIERTDVGVRRDDGAAGKVDALAHHVLAEQALLLFQLLPDALQMRTSIASAAGFVSALHASPNAGLLRSAGLRHQGSVLPCGNT